MKQGTPKTLNEAIELGLQGPAYEIVDNMYDVIKDYIANKMQVPMLTATPKEQQMLSDLFELLTKREVVKPYKMLEDGLRVRVKETWPPFRHGLVVAIKEHGNEWIDPE